MALVFSQQPDQVDLELGEREAPEVVAGLLPHQVSLFGAVVVAHLGGAEISGGQGEFEVQALGNARGIADTQTGRPESIALITVPPLHIVAAAHHRVHTRVPSRQRPFAPPLKPVFRPDPPLDGLQRVEIVDPPVGSLHPSGQGSKSRLIVACPHRVSSSL